MPTQWDGDGEAAVSREPAHTAERPRTVYVVMGWPPKMVNDRVAGILKLRPHFDRMILVARGRGVGDAETLLVPSVPNPVGWLRRLGLHSARYQLERLLFFPSPHVLFTVVAKRRLAAAIASDVRAGHDVCVVTCVPNHENTAVGLYLKSRFPEIHWVVDWQDLWSYDENYFGRVPQLYRRRLLDRERQVLDSADVHLTTNEYAKRILHQVYGVPLGRLRAIHHHFDSPGQVAAAVPPDRVGSGTITIGFLGSLFKPPRVPGMKFLEALQALRASGIDVELHLHGRIPPQVAGRTSWLESAGLVVEPRVPHDQCAGVLGRYDYLLLLLEDLPNSRAVMSIKLPQYLVAGRPILAVVPEPSAVADIVTRARAGYVLPSDSDWRAGLAKVLTSPRPGPIQVDWDVVDEFAWMRLSERWLEALGAPRSPSVREATSAVAAQPR